jgi:hypothetical protein
VTSPPPNSAGSTGSTGMVKRYSSMGFADQLGMWVRWADFDALLSAYDALMTERDGLRQQLADAATVLKAVYHELGGIGRDSSKQFHRIGIDSARGILSAALQDPPHA